MAIPQKIIPYKGVELDNHELNVDEMCATYIKNLTHDLNDNNRVSQDEGSNAYVWTPLEITERYCNLSLPAGTNYVCGFHYFKEANQGFVCGHNNNGNHFMYRIKGNDGTCEMIAVDPCFNFQLDPKHFMGRGRFAAQTICRLNKATGLMENVIYIEMTDNFNDQRFLCIEDVIATHGFNGTDFPYFNTNDPSCDRCTWYNLGVPIPLGCIKVSSVNRDTSDEQERRRANVMNYRGWQFRLQVIDQWNRASEYDIISDTYFTQIGSSCLANSSGLPRCVRLRFPAGCPLVNQIILHFRNCAGKTKGFSTVSDWYKFTTINKYNDCEGVNWWERSINNPWLVEYDAQILLGKTPEEAEAIAYGKGLMRYWAIDNTFEYTFCNDKECAPVDFNKTNRVENPLARRSSSLFPLNRSIALARNMKGFDPMDCGELNKIEFSVIPPSGGTCSNVKLRKVEVWGVFYNPLNDIITRLRFKEGKKVFGFADCPNNNPINYDQIIPDSQEGIIAHMAGTDYYAISKQYRYDTLTDTIEYTGIVYTAPGIDNGRYIPIQKWEFSVLPGKYRFHIASHKATPTDYKGTSTYFKGRTNLGALGSLAFGEERELVIDVCTSDYLNKNTPVMIWDLTHVGKNCTTGSAASAAVAGYMYEDEIQKNPIEMAVVNTNRDSEGVAKSNFTDHYGFYFASWQGRRLQATIRGYKNCTNNQVLSQGRSTLDTVENWYKFDKLYAYSGTTAYPIGDRMIVKGKMTLCGNPTIGLPGVLVHVTRAGFAVTDANGEYKIIMHDIGNSTVRTESLIISQRGSCQILACQEECSFCFTNAVVNRVACGIGVERPINMAPIVGRVNGANQYGPKMGARYRGGWLLHDWMGRVSFVQSSEKHYFDIPSLQETQVYAFSRIFFNLNGAVFPPWVKKITPVITDNLNWDDDDTWVMERVQFIDNTGKTNTAAPTQIRLYYESLNEYNKQNDFATNTGWQFLTEEQNSIQGDMIEFLANADGTIFNKRITALAKYNKEGKYIQIDYTDELKDLKDGTLVKLIRPKQCENKEFFYELCFPIRVVNGQAVVQTGQLNYFDSYLLSRQIPVPTLVKITTTNQDGDIIETSTTENKITAYPFFFEHHSPSDTWGDHCANRGRVYVKNEQEKQRCIKTGIDVSNALVNDGLLNGLHYYEEKDSTILDEQEWGGITICLPEQNIILVICEFTNCILSYNDNAVKTDDNGNVVAPSGDNRFGRPEKKIGNNYGCQLDDINTIQTKDGLVFFLDTSKSALVKHNYNEAEDVSVGNQNRGGYKSWLSAMIKFVVDNNSNPENQRLYFHAGINPKNNKYTLTLAKVAQSSGNYINQDRQPVIGVNDTIAIDIFSGGLKTFLSYTPEYYGAMEGDINDSQLISFRFGEAWRHNKLNNPANLYNRFYGVDVEKVMEVVYNTDNVKVKKYMWTEVYCPQHLFYIDRIITESGQFSRLMPKWWERREKFFCADFKCATNTQVDINIPTETGANALLDGDMLYGRWMRVRYVGIAAAKNAYCELTALIGFMYGSEKSGK